MHHINNYLQELKVDVIHAPLFYRTRKSLRFEVGDPSLTGTPYMIQAYTRAVFLFKEVFREEDDIYLLVNYEADRDDINCLDLDIEAYIKNKEIIKYKSEEVYDHFNGDEDLKSIQHIFACKLGDLDYKDILKAICNMDMVYKPSLGEEVIFINKNRGITYHLYDDCGLDMVFSDKSDLNDMYDRFEGWLLDYDKEEMNELRNSK